MCSTTGALSPRSWCVVVVALCVGCLIECRLLISVVEPHEPLVAEPAPSLTARLPSTSSLQRVGTLTCDDNLTNAYDVDLLLSMRPDLVATQSAYGGWIGNSGGGGGGGGGHKGEGGGSSDDGGDDGGGDGGGDVIDMDASGPGSRALPLFRAAVAVPRRPAVALHGDLLRQAADDYADGIVSLVEYKSILEVIPFEVDDYARQRVTLRLPPAPTRHRGGVGHATLGRNDGDLQPAFVLGSKDG